MYNIPDRRGKGGYLWSSPIGKRIEIDDLKDHQQAFFNWIMNMALARIYNSVELLLLSGIQISYFPNLESPHKGKKHGSAILKAVKDELKENNVSCDLKNNRQLIAFLKFKSSSCASFLEREMNVDMSTTWGSFFEMVSTLRNIIVHEEMAISKDIDNHLNSVGGKAYRFFYQTPQFEHGIEYIIPFDTDRFLFIISRINDFAANVVKFAADQPDFTFIGLYSN
jgi:hypothetical protein